MAKWPVRTPKNAAFSANRMAIVFSRLLVYLAFFYVFAYDVPALLARKSREPHRENLDGSVTVS